MKDFYTRAVELKEELNPNAVMILAKEFGVSVSTANNRFSGYFGKTMREHIRDTVVPSKEQCDLLVAISADVNEFKELSGMSKHPQLFKGLFDRYYGTSTFQKVKATLVSKIPCQQYNPTVDDNRSIFLSQYFGDGSYDNRRNALRIEHGYKQLDYLRFKVSLFNKAWPTTCGLEKIAKRVHTDGYVSYTWYSGKLPNNYKDCHKSVKQLSPLGVLLWYLDDGCYHVSKNGQQIIDLCIPDEKVKADAYEHFKSYGIEFNVRGKSLVLQDSVKVAKFMNCFTRPFVHLVPECMKYKCEMKI